MTQWIFIGLLIGLAAACAALLRWARVPGLGWSILGGVLAGLLMGPDIFGRFFPVQYEKIVVGGMPERESRDAVIRHHGVESIAAETAMFDSQARETMLHRHEAEHGAADRVLKDARYAHQSPQRGVAVLIMAVILFAGGILTVRATDNQRLSELRQSTFACINIALWQAALPGGLAYFFMMWWWQTSPAQAAFVASALAIGPWALTRDDRQAADAVEVGGAQLIQSAGRIASGIAIVLTGWSAYVQLGFASTVWMLPLLALPLGWLSASFIPRPGQKMVSDAIFSVVLVPGLAAMTAMHVEIINDFAFWPLFVILALSDDGRWVGAFVGAMLPGGRTAIRTMRLVIGCMSSGRTQLTMTALGVYTNIIPPPMILPLLLGSALMEMTIAVRQDFARRLAEIEHHAHLQK